jgi:transposase
MDDKDALIKQLIAQNAELKALVLSQAEEIEKLKEKLNKNSNNSSKPPSSDGLSRPNRSQSMRPKGKKKSGGQKGHRGHTLLQTTEPDYIVPHDVSVCSECSKDLSTVAHSRVIKRQVIDIPLPKAKVTEHQALVKECPQCLSKVTGEFPADVTAQVQYGANIKSFALYLQHQHFIPEDRLQELFVDLFGVKLATATLNRFTEKLHHTLDKFEQNVLTSVNQSTVKHLDETGFRISGKTQWLHVASTDLFTYYHVNAKRKALLPELQNTVVHDHWKPYYQLEDVIHALCNAHHLRELNAFIESKELWAKKMKRFLLLGLKYRQHYGEKPIPPDKIDRLIEIYHKILKQGFDYHEALPPFSEKPKRGRIKHRPGHNLLFRLRNYCGDVLRFLTDPDVPFTNNQAERDIRMMKCKQKISGGFRTSTGAEQFARIRGFISTARKQQWNILESITNALNSQFPALT